MQLKLNFREDFVAYSWIEYLTRKLKKMIRLKIRRQIDGTEIVSKSAGNKIIQAEFVPESQPYSFPNLQVYTLRGLSDKDVLSKNSQTMVNMYTFKYYIHNMHIIANIYNVQSRDYCCLHKSIFSCHYNTSIFFRFSLCSNCTTLMAYQHFNLKRQMLI